ncbi:anti-sigma factor family protein [Nocardioides pelophilus]|uniref:anti-sigma factor family protein n=1 Tax=Nocardioides pelophilus TaxID=2172019 RepID=UPI001C80812B|nr:zf-HC2 domain-containing protein [Nocardioides pelophilus]
MRVTCPFSTFDGAYVLGSLAAAARAEYEHHLTGCDECSRAVRELAGMPGLLARVPADVLEQLEDRPSVPDTLLPGLVTEARRDQRRRSIRSALAAAAAVAVVAGGSAAILASRGDDGRPTASPSTPVETTGPTETTGPGQPLTQVGGSSSTGWVSLTPVPWGTRLDLTCEYESPYGTEGTWTYAMVVRTTDGRVEQVASWLGIPGLELHIRGATAVSPDDIAAIEVRDAAGDAVLRLTR